MSEPQSADKEPAAHDDASAATSDGARREPREIGGRTNGLDPTRYGDWEKNGRCIDF